MQSDLAKLQQKIMHGYRERAIVFYVTTTDEDGKIVDVAEVVRAS